MKRGVACLLALLSFVLHVGLMLDFERIGALQQGDWLFDADTKTRLDAFTENLHLGIKHPNIMPYFSPAVGGLGKMAVQLMPSGIREGDVRRRLGTLIVPAASALQTALLFLLFCRLGYALAAATVATLLAQLSFGSLIFGTVPESYGLTALALAMGYAYAAGAGRGRGGRQVAGWIALGVFATGVTITNLVYVPIFLFVIALDRGEAALTGVIRGAAFAVVILAITGSSAWVFDRLLVPPPAENAPASVIERITGAGRHQVATFAAEDPQSRLLRFPTSIANSIAPSSMSWLAATQASPRGPGLTLEKTVSVLGCRDPLGTSILLLVLAGAFCALVDPATRPGAIASVLILASGAVLSAWGTEAFLYSQSWQLAAMVLIAAVMRPRRTAPWMTAALAVLTLAVATSNVAMLRGVFSTLEAIPR